MRPGVFSMAARNAGSDTWIPEARCPPRSATHRPPVASLDVLNAPGAGEDIGKPAVGREQTGDALTRGGAHLGNGVAGATEVDGGTTRQAEIGVFSTGVVAVDAAGVAVETNRSSVESSTTSPLALPVQV
jgi:hypothetical protein